jgi:hypothetical protein
MHAGSVGRRYPVRTLPPGISARLSNIDHLSKEKPAGVNRRACRDRPDQALGCLHFHAWPSTAHTGPLPSPLFIRMHPGVRRDLALSLFSRGSYFQPSIPMIAFHSRRLSCLETRQNGIARMRIIALLFAFVLAGCTGNRLNADTKPIAVAQCAPMAAAVMAATTI